MTFSFRPHHFLCTLGFQGRGYSPSFIENYEKIAAALRHNEELPLRVVPTHDSICGACPHQKKGGCEKEDKIQRLDQQHSQILGLKMGETLSWRKAKERLKKHMTLDAFHHACAGCSWKSLGVCESALKELHNRDKKADA